MDGKNDRLDRLQRLGLRPQEQQGREPADSNRQDMPAADGGFQPLGLPQMPRKQMPVGIKIAGYAFSGPFTQAVLLRKEAGIFVIVDLCPDGQRYPIDVGESSTVKGRVETHERRRWWRINCLGQMGVAVLYRSGWSDLKRRELVKEIRQIYPFPGSRRSVPMDAGLT